MLEVEKQMEYMNIEMGIADGAVGCAARSGKVKNKESRALCLLVFACYRRIDGVVRYIDRAVRSIAENSHNFYPDRSGGFATTEAQVDYILSLMEKKNDLLYLKKVVNEAYKRMDPIEVVLLHSRYVCELSPSETAAKIGASRSGYYAQHDKAAGNFLNFLTESGTDPLWIKERLLTQRWVRRIYERILAVWGKSE